MHRPTVEKPDISEKGMAVDGIAQSMDRRLLMQLLVFGDCMDTAPLIEALESHQIQGVLYSQVCDARGVGLVTFNEDADFFVDKLRHFLTQAPFAQLAQKHQMTMFGRTYSLGYEPDLKEALFDRPKRAVLTKEWPWAVWYPLRRSGAFMGLDAKEQRAILMEHGTIGRAFGEADLAHDVRLACHGMDQADNDFVVGLTGKEFYPLSAIVQRMRQTRQTSQYLTNLGPFFIGKAIWQSSL